VFEEFTGAYCTVEMMCRLIDQFPCTVEIKGGSVSWKPLKVWITSNKSPEEWWPNVGLGGMARRLKPPVGEVIYMGEVFGQPVVETPNGARVSTFFAESAPPPAPLWVGESYSQPVPDVFGPPVWGAPPYPMSDQELSVLGPSDVWAGLD